MRASRLLLAIMFIWLVASDTLVVHAQPPYRRRNINTLSNAPGGGDQFELRQLMMGYINNAIVNEHLTTVGIHCYNAFFLRWHRGYINRMEAWLMTQPNGSKYVPLPKWDPANAAGIPNAFFNGLVAPGSAVMPPNTPLVNQNISGFGNFNFAPFGVPGVCAAYPASTRTDACTGVPFAASGLDNMAQALENQHNPVHNDISGVMASLSSPAAAIFWLWHGYVDDLFRYYQCNCLAAPAKDLYMMDNPLDTGAEPNLSAGGVYWESPDIWIRQNADPYIIATGKYQHEDDVNRCENAEYKTVGDNYVYVRIRNIGCQRVNASEVNLHVYWTKASFGAAAWSADWTNTPPLVPKHGDEITLAPVPVPALDPGQQWVAQVAWHVPNPADYPVTDRNHFCLLGRLVSAVDPMAFPEVASVGTNAQNNNNVAWRNIGIYDLDPFNIIAPHGFGNITFALLNKATRSVRLQFDFEGGRGVHATVDLGRELYDVWKQADNPGRGITALEGTQIRIDEPGASIDGLNITADATYNPGVQAYLQNNADGGAVYAKYGDVVPVRISQYETDDKGNEELTGGFTYELRAVKDKATDGPDVIKTPKVTPTSCPQSADGAIHIDPADPTANVTYWWSNGASGTDQRNLTVGTYTVTARDGNGVVQTVDIAVGSKSTLAIEMGGTNSSCARANGSALVGVTGGVKPYRYQWYADGKPIQGANKNVINKVPAGAYSVVVTDASGCSVTSHVTVEDEMAMLTVFITPTDASSADAKDGAAEAVAFGMMSPFTYQWNTGATTPRITGLAPGVYTVLVTDASGCTASQDVTVSYTQQQTQGVGHQLSEAIGRIIAVVPNPATDQVELRYALKNTGIVEIAIYDDRGRLIDVTYKGESPAGETSIAIDTRAIPSGRYSIRLTCGTESATTPLVIVR